MKKTTNCANQLMKSTHIKILLYLYHNNGCNHPVSRKLLCNKIKTSDSQIHKTVLDLIEDELVQKLQINNLTANYYLTEFGFMVAQSLNNTLTLLE